MSDNRDFDLRNLPGIQEALQNPPAEVDLSREEIAAEMQVMAQAMNWHEPETQQAYIEQLQARVEELEADNTRAWMQVEALTRERDEARELVRMARQLVREARLSLDADQLAVWEVTRKALRQWALETKEEPGDHGEPSGQK